MRDRETLWFNSEGKSGLVKRTVRDYGSLIKDGEYLKGAF